MGHAFTVLTVSQLKIFDLVVLDITADVMDRLVFFKRSTEMTSHH